MLRNIFNIVFNFRFYFTVVKDYRRVQQYYQAVVKEAKAEIVNWELVVDKGLRNRMNGYVLTLMFWNSIYCFLRGKVLQDNELQALVDFSILGPVFDDFFDVHELDEERLKSMMFNPKGFKVSSDLELLSVFFSKKILANVSRKDAYEQSAANLFNAQKTTMKLAGNDELSDEEVQTIVKAKGSETLITMASMLNDEPSQSEMMFLKKWGGLVQIMDDIFDLREDFLSENKSIVNPINDWITFKNFYLAEVNGVMKLLKSQDFNKKRVKAFLVPLKFAFGVGLLGINRYISLQKKNNGNFDPAIFSREELVIDMDVFKNRWSAFILGLKF